VRQRGEKNMITTGQVRVKQSKVTKRLTSFTSNKVTVEGFINELLKTVPTGSKFMYRIKSIEYQMPVDQAATATLTAFGRLYDLRAFSMNNRNLVIKPDADVVFDQ
jgi:hypothetical protein